MPLAAQIRQAMAWPVPMLMPHTIIAAMFGYFAGAMPELQDGTEDLHQLSLIMPFVYINLLHCAAVWALVVAWRLSIGSFLQPIETQVLHTDVLWYFTWRVIFFLTQTHGDNALLWLIHLAVYCYSDMFCNLLATRLKHTPQTSRYPNRVHVSIGVGLLLVMTIVLSSIWTLFSWSWSGVCEPTVAITMFIIVGVKTMQGIGGLWTMYRALVLPESVVTLRGQSAMGLYNTFELVKEALYCLLYALLVAYLAFFMNIYSSGLSLSVSPGSLITALLLRQSIQRFGKLRQQRRNYRTVLTSLSERCRVATAEELRELQDNCAICWEEFSAETAGVQKLPCGHYFHTACLISWMEHDITCPTCRTSLLDNQPGSQRAIGQNRPGPGAQQPPNRPLFDVVRHRPLVTAAAEEPAAAGAGDGRQATQQAEQDDAGDNIIAAAADVIPTEEDVMAADFNYIRNNGVEVGRDDAAAEDTIDGGGDVTAAHAAASAGAGHQNMPQQQQHDPAGTGAHTAVPAPPAPPQNQRRGRTFILEGALSLRFLPRINIGLICTLNGDPSQRIIVQTDADAAAAAPRPPGAGGNVNPAAAAGAEHVHRRRRHQHRHHHHNHPHQPLAPTGTAGHQHHHRHPHPHHHHGQPRAEASAATAAAAAGGGVGGASPASLPPHGHAGQRVMETSSAEAAAATLGVGDQLSPHIENMVEQVHAMFPQFSMRAIAGDILETQDVEETINNILDGRVPAAMLGMSGGAGGGIGGGGVGPMESFADPMSSAGLAQSLLGNALVAGGLRPHENRVQRFPAEPTAAATAGNAGGRNGRNSSTSSFGDVLASVFPDRPGVDTTMEHIDEAGDAAAAADAATTQGATSQQQSSPAGAAMAAAASSASAAAELTRLASVCKQLRADSCKLQELVRRPPSAEADAASSLRDIMEARRHDVFTDARKRYLLRTERELADTEARMAQLSASTTTTTSSPGGMMSSLDSMTSPVTSFHSSSPGMATAGEAMAVSAGTVQPGTHHHGDNVGSDQSSSSSAHASNASARPLYDDLDVIPAADDDSSHPPFSSAEATNDTGDEYLASSPSSSLLLSAAVGHQDSTEAEMLRLRRLRHLQAAELRQHDNQ